MSRLGASPEIGKETPRIKYDGTCQGKGWDEVPNSRDQKEHG
jgi:hypothetical protein